MAQINPTFSLSSMSWYTLLSVPGIMKSPKRTGWQGTTSWKLQPNSSMHSWSSLSNQSLSSGLTSLSWNTRQLSWYHSCRSWTLSWRETKALCFKNKWLWLCVILNLEEAAASARGRLFQTASYNHTSYSYRRFFNTTWILPASAMSTPWKTLDRSRRLKV